MPKSLSRRDASVAASSCATSLVRIPPASRSGGPIASVMRASSGARGDRTSRVVPLVANSLRQPVGLRQIGKARHVRVEVQLDRAGRTVALLADNDLGF